MTLLQNRPAGELATVLADPRDDWPLEARALRQELLQFYGEHDALPDVAGGWIARWPSANTRRTYARGFRVWEAYVRERGGHVLAAGFPLADAFARHLETAPTLRRVKSGRYGEMAPTGKPRTDASRANLLSACSSFYSYAVRARAAEADPFEAVLRPIVDPDESPTEGLTEDETAKLIATATAWSPRAEALVKLLYLMGPRIDELLALDADQLGYDRGHRTLPLRIKGGKIRPKPVVPLALDALERYLDGRTDGPLFTTRTGARLREPEVWKLLRRLAAKAGLPQAGTIKPHVLRHAFITDSLDAGVPLQDVQDAVNHKDPRTTQRYNRRRRRHDTHPGHTLAARISGRLDGIKPNS
ncbi:tyrosine-type recombinase/integrase [Streptomyces sp. NBC_01142]|uniref:tyrosine-type recombinase/integrase n=1 Tax=Streptomyces sp. NBC_01142 TaxID=2975865 RepID=UPI00225A8AC8|nr:tyrosine-type recombinase/integrase [Streptomyces sp. NBC_01142]MCX4826241.1 tyrosine-type recombinase/integrase [Streptomyces sp. NBC_01142]